MPWPKGVSKTAMAAKPKVSPPSSSQHQPPKLVEVPKKRDPRDLRDMDRAQLEAEASRVGLIESRFKELTDDRLKQNIMARLDETFAE